MALSKEELTKLGRQGNTSSTSKTVRTFLGGEYPVKDKVISAKVYSETWSRFTQINKAQGMTNNSVINQLISSYVRDNMDWIE